MPTKEQVMDTLEEVLSPRVMRRLVKMNLVRDVSMTDHKVSVTLSSVALTEQVQEEIKNRVLGQFQIDPSLARLCDEGNIERYDSEMYDAFVENLAGALRVGIK